jgi:hypothetical protein
VRVSKDGGVRWAMLRDAPAALLSMRTEQVTAPRKSKSPARTGEAGRGLDVRSPLRKPGQHSGVLLDHLNDMA